MRDPVDVADEFEHLVKRYGANNIDFVDLTAIVRKDWALSFCKELKQRSLKIPWQLPSGTRSEALGSQSKWRFMVLRIVLLQNFLHTQAQSCIVD